MMYVVDTPSMLFCIVLWLDRLKYVQFVVLLDFAIRAFGVHFEVPLALVMQLGPLGGPWVHQTTESLSIDCVNGLSYGPDWARAHMPITGSSIPIQPNSKDRNQLFQFRILFQILLIHFRF